MQVKTRFFIISFVVLTLFGWAREVFFSARLVESDSSAQEQRSDQVALPLRLLEYLDRLTLREIHALKESARQVNAASPSDLALIPKDLAEHYDIRFKRDNFGRFEVRATPKRGSALKQVIAVNDAFEVRSNERVPSPRSNYLRLLAMRHLRKVRDSQTGMPVGEEESVFKGYFLYEPKSNAQGQRVAIARGVKQPVIGAQLEIGSQEEDGREVEQLLKELMEQSDQPMRRSPAAAFTPIDVRGLEIIQLNE